MSLGAVVKIRASAKGAFVRWQKRVGEGEFTDVAGATGQLLEWSSATVDLSGEYRLVVSSSTGESVTSQIVTVEVDPTFTKITEGPHVTDSGISGFGSWGDYNNDGYQDLVVRRFNPDGHAVYRNNGDGTFSRLPDTGASSTAMSYVCWSDWDNDGWPDLFLPSLRESRSYMFRNEGTGRFTAVENLVTQTDGPAFQGAWGDYDNNGTPDLYVMNGDENGVISTVNQMFHNNGNDNAWLTVKLVGTASNRDSVGAKVRALATYAGEARWQRRDISGGEQCNGNHRHAHFGLGDATKVDTLRIEWPSGIVQELTDVTVNHQLQIVESQGLNLPEPLSIQTSALDAEGVFHATVNCPVEGAVCVLESSADLERWIKVKVGTVSGGTVELTDAHAAQSPTRFYRVSVP